MPKEKIYSDYNIWVVIILINSDLEVQMQMCLTLTHISWLQNFN